MTRLLTSWRMRVGAGCGAVAAVGLLAFVGERAAWAHDEAGPVTPETLWGAWHGAPLLIAGLLVAAGLYARGIVRLWRRAGVGQGVRRWQVAAFAGGLGALVLALASPLEALAGTLFSAHMVQHLVLVLGAAPLLVLGAPLYVWLWALPPDGRKALGRWVQKATWLRALWGALAHPLFAWGLYAATMWLWHAPPLFEAALNETWVHHLEHASYLLAAALYCWILLRPMGARRLTRGAGILYLFTTSAHGSLLGVLITFAPRPWYAHYAEAPAAWGLTPLQDQQLAGLIMWIPVGIVYAGLAALLFVLWMRDVAADVRASERRWTAPVDRPVIYPVEEDEP